MSAKSRSGILYPFQPALVRYGLRAFGRTSPGRRFAASWYQQRAERMARELGALRGVQAVYLTGSSLRAPRLGYSDIDLILAVDVPSLDDELKLRHRLMQALERHNRPFQLFQHIDYVEAGDLQFLARLGNAFALGLGDWSLMTGSDVRAPAVPISARHVELARGAESLRHWVNQCGMLLEGWQRRHPSWSSHAVRRMLHSALCLWLGTDKTWTLEGLLELARGRPCGPALSLLCLEPGRWKRVNEPTFRVAVVLAAILEVLEAWVQQTFHEVGTWPACAEPARLEWVGQDDLGQACTALGFENVQMARRAPGSPQHVAFVTAPASMTSLVALTRYEALIQRMPALPEELFGKANYPILMTPTLFKALALVEPYPLVGASLASGAVWTYPTHVKPSPAPAREDLLTLITMAEVMLFWRPRGRSLRVLREGKASLAALARDVLFVAPALSALRDGSAHCSGTPGHDVKRNEAELIGRLRDHLQTLRLELESKPT
ncbi:MAG TPA: hypothetical protein VK524_21345 [Polyangiaceae bacterium]|nr:hypothetical protein [Polyangiaceae bacterium]